MRTRQQTRPVHYHGAGTETGERSIVQEGCPPVVRVCAVWMQPRIAAGILSPAAKAWFEEGYYKQVICEIGDATPRLYRAHHFDQLILESYLSQTTLSQNCLKLRERKSSDECVY